MATQPVERLLTSEDFLEIEFPPGIKAELDRA